MTKKKLSSLKLDDSTPKCLMQSEVDALEHHRLLCELRAKEAEIIGLRREVLSHKQANLMLQSQIFKGQADDIDRDALALADQKRADSKVKDDCMAQIKTRLDIKGAFGYDPLTLEISEG